MKPRQRTYINTRFCCMFLHFLSIFVFSNRSHVSSCSRNLKHPLKMKIQKKYLVKTRLYYIQWDYWATNKKYKYLCNSDWILSCTCMAKYHKIVINADTHESQNKIQNYLKTMKSNWFFGRWRAPFLNNLKSKKYFIHLCRSKVEE